MHGIGWVKRRSFLKAGLAGLAALTLPSWRVAATENTTRVAFGSCARQERPQPIWDAICARDPDLFVFLGDNVYGNTRDMTVLRDQYASLAAKPEFRRFRRRVPVFATWDDHDYGENNADASYPMKRESKQIFLDFFNEPRDSERRTRAGGIYASYVMGGAGRRLQLILLDTRYHRAPFDRVGWPKAALRKFSGRGPFAPAAHANGSMLGAAQWKWLEQQLTRPADLRIVATSTPFLSSFTGSETWANLPHERGKLIELVRKTEANGVIFISGDIHRAELSAAGESDLPYPLWEMTSSGLNRSNMYESFNRNRIGEPYRGHNFGLIEVDWEAAAPILRLQACDRDGTVVISQDVELAGLRVSG